MILLRTTSTHPDFRRFVERLDTYPTSINGEDDAYYQQFNTIDALKYAVVAYADDVAVGCGAFKPFDKQAVEIKRMFVEPDYRGHGIAKAVLAKLEQWS